ncbi:glycoside hydrolase family 13 protein [Lasiosphaeria ovina]|uniref:alpha-amylase n=1 Tax=Lasiosphaeria ovina TaxID=92902 RepID=A0AAE0NBL8_9PEZI|nr:glycoside hydrolase family 13 protein [Lasiosphaeria ovina]
MRSSGLNVAAAAGLAFAGLSAAANVTEWKTRSIYQVMIDRFARTDGSTTAPCDDLSVFCNGTWTGLINKLDYIQDMGFTAVQISPIVTNIEEETSVGMAYHGYWTKDMYGINQHFGTQSDFQNLVAELHKRKMYVMVDVVVNNMAQKFDNKLPPKVDFSQFDPFNDQKFFHPYCNVTMWENATDYQDCWLYPYGVALADLDTDSSAVVQEMGKWVKELVSNYSIDGLRIDAAKHVDDAFLPQFVNASGVFAWGEVLTGVTPDMCRYQLKDLLPGMPNYLEYYPLNVAFNGGSMDGVLKMKQEAATGCTDVLALGSFIENHDMPRFASQNPDMALARNAMTYVLLNDGIPTIYQGQEQHFKGNGTPFNREALWLSGYNTSAPLYQLAKTLNKVRNNAIALSKDYVGKTSESLLADTNHLCLTKGPNGSQVVFCVNNWSSTGASYSLNVGGFQASDAVVEVLTCTTMTADGTGTIATFQGAGEPKVYVPAAALNGTGLCPQTTAAKPIEGTNKSLASAGAASSVLVAAMAGFAALFFAL